MGKKNIAFFEQEDSNKIKEFRFSPCQFLQEYVKEFMIVETLEQINLETLPSTSVSLNYILNGAIKMKQKNNTVILPKAFAFGIARKSLHFEFSNSTALFVIIFNPGMASSLINTPINEFFEKFIPFDTFFSPYQVSFLDQLFLKKYAYKVLIKAIERFFLVEIVWAHTDGIVKKAIHKIITNQVPVSIKELLDELPISRDSLEKKFRKQVGTSPKQFSNIVRFRNLFEKDQKQTTLTEIGLNAGYYDQAHFIKDFKAITGKKPSSFL